MQNKKILSFADAINDALRISMSKNKKILLIGLGVNDPKSIFGTTKNLNSKILKNQVYDMPTAENSMMGIGIGLAIRGFRPIISHQRVEFSLLAMEQIINQAAKWSYMFAGTMKVPLVIRLIIGKVWGQGPQHSQSLESIFAHIPGLKVICPSNAYDAKGLLISSIEDNNPVIFFEHRWLHHTKSFVPKKNYKIPLGKAKILTKGKSLTIVSSSLMTNEILSLKSILNKNKIFPEIIDLRSLRPLDKRPIIKSVKKTKRLLVLDNGWTKYGISAEIISSVLESIKIKLLEPPLRLGLNDSPIPSSRSLAKYSYLDKIKILNSIAKIMKKKINTKKFSRVKLNQTDIPDEKFTGPF